MKLSVTMMSFEDYVYAGKMTVEEFIDLSGSYGIDAVDLLAYFWKNKEEELLRIPHLLREKGLSVGAYCVGNNFTVLVDQRPGMIQIVKDGVDTALRLGTNRVRIFGGSSRMPEELKKDRVEIVIECIGECIGYAKENNVTLVLENHGGVPLTSQEMLHIIEAVNSPCLKLNFDMGNFMSYQDENPLDAAKVLYPYVDHIHVKDLTLAAEGTDKYQPCLTGEGIVPIRECLQFFWQKGYNHHVTLEYEAYNAAESKTGVKSGLEYLKKIIKECKVMI